MKPIRALGSGLAVAGALLALAPGASAYNYVSSSNGENWGVQDSAAPRVDTGSIRDTTSNSLRGFGGVRVRVSTQPRMNGELIRGFNLKFNPPERFSSTNSVDLGGVAISRQVRFNRAANWGRWLDTFKNVTDAPITVDAVFGGQLGIGNASGSTNNVISATSSGDTTLGPDDSWELNRTGTAPATTTGPSAVVIGTPAPFPGAMTRTANFLASPFTQGPAATGHESNFLGFQNSFTLAPGEAKTIARFVVIGKAEAAAGTGDTAPGAQQAIVQATATSLATSPSAALADLTKAELCALVNWDVNSLTSIRAFDPATDCATAGTPKVPDVSGTTPTTTGAKYDVVNKTIGQLQADMVAGVTTSQEITRAYLDRVRAYDVGAFGFNSMTTIADDALAQAKAADDARAAGKSGALLGIPLAVKDLYDTKDMPTTNGSLVFEGYRPKEDSTQVALLRKAGAVILGKASLEEYALSGQYSDSAFGQVWNAFSPSKSPLASSGGTAVATALSLAAGGLGSQTGDSLYAPAGAASLYTLRGTDGMASLAGIMPLSWLQDYGGAITRSLPDLADILDATTGTDPRDPITVEADADSKRPASWHTSLKDDALQGKRIGYYDSAFVDPFGTTDTVDVQKAALAKFEQAGATLVKISAGPTIPAAPSGLDRAYQGWADYIASHPDLPYQDPREILASPKRLPYRRSLNGYTGTGAWTQAQIDAYKAWRNGPAKQAVTDWMDNPPSPVDPDTADPSPGALDAVAFPALKSVLSLNDGGSAAFGRGDPPTNGAGVPSVAFPAGINGFGEPTNLQLAGRAWDDAKLMGYAYAFDQVAKAHIEPTTAPPLTYVADPVPPAPQAPAPVPAQPSPLPPITSPIVAAKPVTVATKASSALKLTSARKTGIMVTITVDQPSVMRVELKIRTALARKYRISSRIGSAKRTVLKQGTYKVKLYVTPKAANALRRTQSVKATLTTTATTVDGRKATSSASLRLRR